MSLQGKKGRVKMSTVKKVAETVKETVAVEKKPAVKTVAKKATAKKEETKAAVVEAVVEVKEEVKKPVEKKVATKKATAKAAEEKKPAAKKAVAKTTATKKPATKKAAKTDVKVAIQFADKNYTAEDLAKIANDVWVYDYGKDASELKDVQLYVKPEESKVYYVFNNEIAGDFVI